MGLTIYPSPRYEENHQAPDLDNIDTESIMRVEVREAALLLETPANTSHLLSLARGPPQLSSFLFFPLDLLCIHTDFRYSMAYPQFDRDS